MEALKEGLTIGGPNSPVSRRDSDLDVDEEYERKMGMVNDTNNAHASTGRDTIVDGSPVQNLFKHVVCSSSKGGGKGGGKTPTAVGESKCTHGQRPWQAGTHTRCFQSQALPAIQTRRVETHERTTDRPPPEHTRMRHAAQSIRAHARSTESGRATRRDPRCKLCAGALCERSA